MWRYYLELSILVVLAFAIGAGVAALVVRRLVKDAPPADETTPETAPTAEATS